MTGFEIAMMAVAAATASVAAALVVANLKLTARIKTLTADYAALEQKIAAAREQNQQDLMAIGRRVLEVDKIAKRLGERLDAIENNRSSVEPQYGQLQDLVKQAGAIEAEASIAEKELMSLLSRGRKLSS